jgi:hypothetical protein
MPHPPSLRPSRSWLILLVLAAFGAFGASTASAAPTPHKCDSRVNNTAKKLLPCIQTADLWQHMMDFQAIADANPGPDGHASRNSGEPGYLASVRYVAKKMQQAGYKTSVQTYQFPYSSFVGTPSFSITAPTPQDFTLGTTWNAGISNGTADADVVPAGGIILPPTPTPSSASGCTSADFAGFPAGKIALVQRGTCNFGVKVVNAQNAGASGILIFNEGQPGRTGIFGGGTVIDADNNIVDAKIPIGFITFDTGSQLYQAYKDGKTPHAKLDVHSVIDPNRNDYNLIAESKGGDPNHVVVVDAHLDAIFGAGMLDNASGSATILDIAEQMRKVNPRNKLRFIWFGGEELGLLGSSFYVDNLPPAELAKIGYDLDADVTATKNGDWAVLDPAADNLFGGRPPQFPANVYAPSLVGRDQAVDYLDSIFKNHIFFSPVGTDAFNFNVAGVPASGVLTGQDCCKTAEEVSLFGGFEGNFEGNVPSFDGGCVDNPFRWCDNLSNNDPGVLTFMSRAFANQVIHMAFAKDLSSPIDTSPQKRQAIAAGRERSRGAVETR